MKHTKKLASLLLALVMVFALATTAFAAENAAISAPEGSTRTYDVYQIFTGDLHEGVLSNIKWGKNGTGTEGTAVDQTTLAALAAVNGKSNTEKLTEIQKYVKLDSEKFGTVSNGNPLTVPTGYYLIKDNGPVNDGEAYSLYVVQVVGPTTISPKVGTTTSDKKVDDKNDSNTTEDATTWQDSADYDIGDAVPFKLSATIAQDYANYTHGYKLTFHDKEGAGLSFNQDSVKVYVDGTLITTGYEVVTEGLADGCTFEVRFANLKDIASVKARSVISVEYTSTLNDQAVIGSAGNKNTSHVTYTNNPNDAQAGENGKTPDDAVIVFTYKTIVNKVTKNPNYDPKVEGSEEYIPLKGAGFTLYKKNASGAYEAVGSELKGADMTTFTWSGLDDGDYKLVETTTPSGYNTIPDIEFTITATHDVSSDNPTLISLSGGDKFTGVISTGVVSANIENQSGAQLPSTGGIGTTIFYVLGSVLVIGAAVLLVTKKRMSTKG
jgi:fimbrial isopeptide formation D2 family protein/LPXTG-motif cell wall-anchored protein